MNTSSQKGFTFVEVLIAVAIVAIFSVVTFASLGQSRARSRDAVRIGDVKNLAVAAEHYFVENGEFPSSIDDLGQYFEGGVVPADPQGESYSYLYYETEGGNRGYCAGAVMETNIESPAEPDADCPSDMGNYIIKGP